MERTENKVKRCYTYIRVSTEMQVDGFSLEAQRDKLSRYATYQGLEIVREYCDAGKSGKSITGRPEFQKMLQDVSDERDGVDFILVFKLSRFGRNAADVLNSLQLIQDYGVNLVCVEDGIDSSKESGKLTITVLSAVAEIERENILVQTMEGRKQKAREGKWNGGPAPYGYRLNKEKDFLEVEPEEAKVVKMIFDMYAKTTKGIDLIVDYINNHGYEKTTSRSFEVKHFTRSFVTRMLDNPVYIGKIAYGKTVTKKVKGTRDNYQRVYTDEYLMAEGIHEAIIDEDTWNAVRTKRLDNGVKWNKTHSMDHEHILSGLTKCPICGAGLVGQVIRKTSKKTGEYKDNFYYNCLHRRKINDGRNCSFRTSVNQDILNKEVEKIVLDLARDKNLRNLVLSKLSSEVDVDKLEMEKQNLLKQIQQIDSSKQKLMDQIENLDLADRHYARKSQDMQVRLDSLYDKLEVLTDTLEEVKGRIRSCKSKQVSTEKLLGILENYRSVYSEMTDLERKEFFNAIVEKIEIHPEITPEGNWVKHIDFKFPMGNCEERGNNGLINETTVETVVLLSNKKAEN